MILLAACADPPPAPVLPEPPPPSGVAPAAPAPGETPPPAPLSLPDDVRERVPVVIGGKPETWEIRWTGPRTIDCWADISCPCDGFGIAEVGPADLVRVRDGVEIDRLALGPLFTLPGEPAPEAPVARLQRATGSEADEEIPPDERAAELARRPRTALLELHDYDQDGQDAELLLQVDAGPCGHSSAVLIGLGRDGKLQGRRTAEHPEAPLLLDSRGWGSLGDASEVVVVECGDHGADVQITNRLWFEGGELHGDRRVYACTEKGERGAQQSEERL